MTKFDLKLPWTMCESNDKIILFKQLKERKPDGYIRGTFMLENMRVMVAT